jgi:very-short-patch-repair endonuclease
MGTATAKPKRKLARHMRSNPSLAERKLWERLRHSRLEGLKFRRQTPLGPYVVDFLCLRHRLVIEVDGPVHELRPEDPAREAWLISQRFRILRFTSSDVLNRIEDVLARVVAEISVPPLGEVSATPHPSASG